MSVLTLHAQHIMEPYEDARFALPPKFRYWSIPHTHDFYEIFLVAAGTVTHIVNNVKQALPAGTMVFVRPHDVHSFEKNGNGDMCYMNVNFRASTVLHAFDYLGSGFKPERLSEPALPPVLSVSPEEIEHTLGLYKRTVSLLAGSTSADTTPVRAFLMEMLLRYFYPQTQRTDMAGPGWLFELLEEMDGEISLAEGLAKMQRRSPVSPEHLCRTMKKHLGKSPTEWINERRLRAAAFRLRAGTDDIAAICYDVGFNSLSYFYTLFCKQYGMSPSVYRRSGQRNEQPKWL
ncbi:helix-turn-helix domain-containing protein [Paenibacillus ginsengarvi]|nr:helix-turn-helix domain-containing protein [Paenibacillus ginsengarvi]